MLVFLRNLYTKSMSSRHMKIKAIFALSVIIVIVIGCTLYCMHSKRYITTDNAYVNANIVQVSSQVSGQIVRLYVQNNQFVKKGALLFELDSEPLRIAVDKAKAQLVIAYANLENVQSNSKRIIMLSKKGSLSIQDQDNAIKNLQVATAAVQLDKVSLESAELNLRNSKIFATSDGYVSNMSLRVGSMVNALHPLFALISNEQYWIDANFKENELLNIKPGQMVKITIDMYPSYVFKGIVDSISSGSGSVFSLLPPQNATGNWIKVVQRVPVKIRILNADSQHQLRVGTTATVTIDTKKHS